MKLYEYDCLLKVAIVIAAESEVVAKKQFLDYSTEEILNIGEVIGPLDRDCEDSLVDERELKSEDPWDEANDVVWPQIKAEASEQQATNQGQNA